MRSRGVERSGSRSPLVVACAVLALELIVVGGPHVADWWRQVTSNPASTRLVESSSPEPRGQQPLPAVDYGPLSTGGPVIWGVEAGNRSWLVAFDWAGRPVGTLKLRSAAPAGTAAPVASPDGGKLWWQDTVIDARGDVDVPPKLPSAEFVWARGSDGFCGATPSL